MYLIKAASFLSLLLFVQLSVSGQGIRGKIINKQGETLPNASIFINELKVASISNVDGLYSVKLPAGKFTINVSYLGYKSQQFVIEINEEWVEKDFVLTEQGILLKEVTVGNNSKEDYAYTIIRKAIAKRKFHQLQYNSFQMTAYIKGSSEIKKVPIFFRNKLKKEGLLDAAYAMESVSHFKFSQPNKIEQKVISIRTKGKEKSKVSPSSFLKGNFYNDKFNGVVSPLSKTAFTYYKFKYEGSFAEKEHIIYKIKIVPRSKGDNVFSGFIYIIDKQWAIHSLDLTTSSMGSPIIVKQNYAEVAENVWLPITYRVNILFNILGFAFDYNYLISCTDYQVVLNKELIAQTEIIDESIGEKPNGTIDHKLSGKRAAADLLASPEPVTRKQYVKLIEKYEKEALKEQKSPKQLLSNTTFSIDSMAARRDSGYWDSIRPVPLTLKEQKGYTTIDSITKVQIAKTNDSLAKDNDQKFKFSQIITGKRYSLSKHTDFTLQPVLNNVHFNTVEGLNVNLGGTLLYKRDTLGRFAEFTPMFRYGFTSDHFYAKGKISYGSRGENRSRIFYIEGGSFVEQFNRNGGIGQRINTLNTLIMRRNYMNIYEKQSVLTGYSYSPTAFLKLNGNIEWSQRSQLYNTNDYSFFFRASRSFTSNVPQNIELSSTSFQRNQALTLTADISYRPLGRYRIVNGKNIPLPEASPELTLTYVKGISSILKSNVDYDKLQFSINHSLPVGAGSRFSFEFSAGSFLNNSRTYFMDYQHFDSNLTPLASLSPISSFRLLDYYFYSTDRSWLSGLTNYKFRKFLVTRIPELRLLGLKENIFVNYLKTSSSPHYYEFGYSLDNIFRVLRAEVATAYTNGSYKEFGFRFGLTTMISISKKK